MGLFPPGKGGGDGVDYGRKGKGILIYTLTEANGMPLANCTTPAQSRRLKSRRRSDACEASKLRNEREQVVPLLDRVKVKTKQPGRLRKRVKVLAAERTLRVQCLRSAKVRWLRHRIAYFDKRTTQKVVEGINNKLKLIKRRAFGFRNFDNLQLRSFLTWQFAS